MPKGEYFEAFPPKWGFGPSISQIKGRFHKANAFYSSFGIMFCTLPSICFIWQYCNYRPAIHMCSTEAKHREQSTKVLLNFQEAIFHGWSSCSLSLITQGNDKALLFLIDSEPLITIILKGNKTEQVHSNHITNKGKTSQFHLEEHLSNSDCSHYRNTTLSSAESVLWLLISPLCYCKTSALIDWLLVYPLVNSRQYIPTCSCIQWSGNSRQYNNIKLWKTIRKHPINKSISPEAEVEVEESGFAEEYLLNILWFSSFGCSNYMSEKDLCAGNEVFRNCTSKHYHKKFLYTIKVPILYRYVLVLLLCDTSAWENTIFVIRVE